MTDNTHSSDTRTEKYDPSGLYFPNAVGLTQSTEVLTGFYRSALATLASQLQNQADYVKKLSETENPADALGYQSEFAGKALTLWLTEGWRALEQTLSIGKSRK